MEQLQAALRQSLQEQWKMEHSRIAQTSALIHDLKTPLTVIDGNTQLLAETELTAEQREYVDAVLKNTAAAGEYLERLKKIARSPAEGAARKTAMSGEHVQAELIREAEELCRVYGLTVKGDKTELPELEAALPKAVALAVSTAEPPPTATTASMLSSSTIAFILAISPLLEMPPKIS